MGRMDGYPTQMITQCPKCKQPKVIMLGDDDSPYHEGCQPSDEGIINMENLNGNFDVELERYLTDTHEPTGEDDDV